MNNTNKRIIVSGSLILLLSSVILPNTASLAEEVTPSISPESSPITMIGEQSPPISQSTSSNEDTTSNTEEKTNGVLSPTSDTNVANLNEEKTVSTTVKPQSYALDEVEQLDSWMPNTELQNLVADKLGIDKSEITKELLANSELRVNYDEDRAFFYLSSYEGLQFFSSISAYISASSEGSSLSYLRDNPIEWENFSVLPNLSIGVDGDLTTIFPNGIDLSDNRINIDPHNIYFINEVNLNQNNFSSFFLSYSQLKLLNIDPSNLYSISDLTFGEWTYNVTPGVNGLQFDLTNNIDYTLIAGKSYVNTDEYFSFPDGPYVQISLQNKSINSRINLHFALPGADVTVRYIDQDGEEISPSKTLTGGVGENYISDQLVIPGYTFKEVNGSATGVFTNQPQNVTYVYTKDITNGSDVTVRYEDTDGNKISPDVVKTGAVGDIYTTEQKNIKGYSFKEVQGNTTGTFTNQPQSVTYVYTKDVVPVVVGADILVKYVDTNGNKISDDVVKSGNLGETYSTEQKAIKGYTFEEVQGNTTGTFTNQPQTVTYVYTKDVVPVVGADILVKYVDTNGNKVSDDVVKSGNLGETYSTEQKVIKGYTFKEVQGNTTGTFTNQPQTVTYIYTKNTEKVSFVTVKYVDTNGNKIATDVVKTGNIGENYTTEQKDIEGYSFKEVTGSVKGIFTDTPLIVTYVYSKYKTVAASGDSKIDNTPTSKYNIKRSHVILSEEYSLPETSDNTRMTLSSTILGFFFLLLGVLVTLLRSKKTNK